MYFLKISEHLNNSKWGIKNDTSLQPLSYDFLPAAKGLKTTIEIKKHGDFRNSLVFLGVTSLLHVAQWVSRAPPHHTIPAFLNPNGRVRSLKTLFKQSNKKMTFFSQNFLLKIWEYLWWHRCGQQKRLWEKGVIQKRQNWFPAVVDKLTKSRASKLKIGLKFKIYILWKYFTLKPLRLLTLRLSGWTLEYHRL